jgi:hypothetical protein
MPQPANVTTPEAAHHYIDEYRVGTMLAFGASTLAFVGSMEVESAPESQLLGVASGLALALTYSSARKVVQFHKRMRELEELPAAADIVKDY